MVVYADILVLVNMYVDLFLLLMVKRSLHLKLKAGRLFAASLTGGLSGLTALLPLPEILNWLLLFLSAVLICLLAFPDRRLLPKASALFFLFSLILSGGVFLLTELAGLPAAVIAGRIYFQLSPILLFVFTVAIYLLSVLLENLLGSRDDIRSLNFAVIETELGTAEVLLKSDTGNSLREPFSGLPAAVVELDALLPVIPRGITEYLLGGEPREGLRLIPCSTVNGRSLLPAFKPKSFYLADSRRELDCYIAVSKSPLSNSAWRGLIDPEIL